MKTRFLFPRLALALSATLALPMVSRAEGSPPTPDREAKPPVQAVDSNLPQSVFMVPASPADGRDPFFPRSTRGQPKVVERKEAKGPDTSLLVLNGISGPPRRTAIINGRTFERGEAGEVRMASGARVLITCEEITESGAVVRVGTQRKELRLRGSAPSKAGISAAL
jgi:hypothetical protein